MRPTISRTPTLGLLVALSAVAILGCSQTPACDTPSAVESVKSQLSQRLATFVGTKTPVSVTAFAPTDKGLDPTTHVRLCTGIASSGVGAPTVTYTIARSSDGKPVVQISNVEPDQSMREAAVSNSQPVRLKADTSNLVQIATALEEYAIDHNGKYPRSLRELGSPYMFHIPSVPGSGGSYALVIPPTDSRMGAYEIIDDGTIGANSGLRTVSGDICDPDSCRYVIYAAGLELMGGASSAGTL